MENKNNYLYEELPGSKILLDEKIYIQLMGLASLSGLFYEEKACLLYGREICNNVIHFYDSNQKNDFVSNGTGSKDPLAHSVVFGEQVYLEMMDKIKNNRDPKFVICDMHTHPGLDESGFKELYRFFSDGDYRAQKNLNKMASDANGAFPVTILFGLMGVDFRRGNDSITFVWYSGTKHYRIDNVKVLRVNEKGETIECDLDSNSQGNMGEPFMGGENVTYINTNFGVQR